MRTATTKIHNASHIVRVAIDVNVKVYMFVKLDRPCSCTQFWWSFGSATELLAHLSCFLCLLERQEARPDVKTRRETAPVTCSKKTVFVFRIVRWRAHGSVAEDLAADLEVLGSTSGRPRGSFFFVSLCRWWIFGQFSFVNFFLFFFLFVPSPS